MGESRRGKEEIKNSKDEMRGELINPMDDVKVLNRQGIGPDSKPEEPLHSEKAWIHK